MTKVIATVLTLLLGACASTQKDPMLVEIEEAKDRRADTVQDARYVIQQEAPLTR